jgi:HEAT repeat protein
MGICKGAHQAARLALPGNLMIPVNNGQHGNSTQPREDRCLMSMASAVSPQRPGIGLAWSICIRSGVKGFACLALLGAILCLARDAAAAPVDDLVKKLKDKDGEVRLEACENLGKLGTEAKSAVGPLIQLVNKESSSSVKRAAIEALGLIGPDAKSAASTLVTVFKSDAALRDEAGKALVKIGSDTTVSSLTRLLPADKTDKKIDNALRSAAATTLGNLGPEAKGAVKALKAVLADKDIPLKRAAIGALGKIGPDAKEAVPELVDVLTVQNAQVKLDAIDALGKVGADSKLAIRELGKLVNDPNAAVANKSIEGLTKIGKNAMPALVEGLKNKDANRRLAVLRLLVANRIDATAALPELLTLATDRNPQINKLALELLGFLGKEAVPELVKLLKDKEQPDATQRLAALALSKAEADKSNAADLLGLLKDPRPEVRKAGAEALAKTGADAQEFFAELVAAMGDKDEAVRNAVGQSIRNTGRKGVAQLQEMLAKEKDPAAKANLLYALGAMGPLAKGSIDDLAKYLNDPDEGVKKSAAAALEKVSRDSVPALLKLLDSKDASVRMAAVLAVAEAGNQAKEALPILADLGIKDADAGVRRSALVALRSVAGMELKEHAGKVGQALTDKDKDVRAQAALTLAEIGAAAEPAIPGLIVALGDKETVVAQAAGDALGKVGGPAVNPLVEALKDANPLVRRHATMALKEIGAKAKNAVPMLIDALHDSDDATRQFAALALNEIGADAKAASIDLIYAMLRDKDKEVRNRAALALLHVNPEPALAAPAFRQGLRDRKAQGVTDSAVEGLTKLGAVAVPVLRDALKDKDKIVRRLAAEVLGKLGAAAMPAVPDLKETAKDADAAVKGAAEKALKEIGG